MKHLLQTFMFLIIVVLLSINVMGQPVFNAFNVNPVLEKGQSGEWDSQFIIAPQIIVSDSVFYLFYTGTDQSPMSNSNSIGFATSDSGFNFTKHAGNPFLSGDGSGFDSLSVTNGALLIDGDSLVIYYSASGIGRATALTPAGPWNRLEYPVLENGNSGEWDAGYIHAYSVLKDGNTYIMFYTGGDVPPPGVHNFRIGMATSTDGINWIKYDDLSTTTAPYAESDPVLMPGSMGNWDDYAVWQPSVIKRDSVYEMFYLGHTLITAGIGYANSSDGINWVKVPNNAIYTISDDPYAVSSGGIIESPTVCVKDGQYFMYYDYGFDVGAIGLAADPAIITSVEKNFDRIPKTYYLLQNYPNPFNPETTIEISIPKSEFVTLKVYNILGQEVSTLVSDKLNPGNYKYTWDASEYSSGVYFYKIEAGAFIQTKKLIFLK
jgi:hypothetical protein